MRADKQDILGYDYDRKLKGSATVAAWIAGRFKATDTPSSATSYPILDGEKVLGPKGRVIE